VDAKDSALSEDRSTRTAETAASVIAFLSQEGVVLYLNRTGRRVLGIQDADRDRVLLSELMLGRSEQDILSRVLEDGKWSGKSALRHQRSGAAVPVHATFSALKRDANGSSHSIALEANLLNGEQGPVSSVTELRAAKMDSVARLIAGLSDNLEALLPSVSFVSEIALDGLEEEDPRRARAEQALNACHRAAALMRQLQAVARRQTLEPRVVNGNDKVLQTLKLLSTALGDDIEIKTELSSHPTLVRADPFLLEQVLLHLIVNARDAMPQGGKLTLNTETVSFGEDPLSPRNMRGPYVRISVTDTGHGMDTETMGLLFEPFFSTKENGTGLGLATVYGILSQSGGHVVAESRPGAGATFTVYIPSVESPST
jgi:signal transduction histidine kinase